MLFFLDVRKACDTVWRDGLWVKLWDMGVKRRMWHVIKNMYEASRSADRTYAFNGAVLDLCNGAVSEKNSTKF